MFLSGANAFNLAPDVPPHTSEAYHVTYNPPITSKSQIPANTVAGALDTLLSNVTRHQVASGTSPHVSVFKEMVYTPPIAPGDTGIATHVLRTLQGMGKTTVVVDAFNDNNIIINTSADDTTTIPYNTPVGASASVPLGSVLQTFLDLLSLNVFQHQLASATPPPPGPTDSYAVIHQPGVTINTGTNPDTKSLNLRYIHSNNLRLQVSNTPDSVDLNLNLPFHRSYYLPDASLSGDQVIPVDAFQDSTSTRFAVEVYSHTVNDGVVDGRKRIFVPINDIDGVIDENYLVVEGFCQDTAIGFLDPSLIRHIEVSRDFNDGSHVVSTTRWDGSAWQPFNTPFFLRFTLFNQPTS